MNFNLLNTLIFAGIIQGFFFGLIYLFSKKYKGISTFYLAALILTFSYNNLQFFLSDSGIMTGKQMYLSIYIPVGSLIPVFIYFYVLTSIDSNKKITKKLKLLYIPFFVFLLFLALPYKIEGLLNTSEARYPTYRFLNAIQSSFSLLYTLTLILISYFTLNNYLKSLKASSKLHFTQFKWLKNTLLLLIFLSCFWAFALIKFFSNPDYQFYFNFLWLGLSITIYWLGHFGIYKYGIQKERHKIRSFLNKHKYDLVDQKTKNQHIKDIEGILIQNQGYLNPNLTLDSLAEQLKLSKSHVSRIINTELNMSFSDYVNSLRIDEAKKLLLNPEFSNYTLVSIGLEAGFSSKTTFNTTFKKYVGMSPSQFKKENN